MMNTKSFLSIFKATPLPMLVLMGVAPHFTITDVNSAFLIDTNSKEHDIIGKSIFSVFPHTSEDENQAISDLRESLEKVLSSKIPDKIPAHKYHSQSSKPEKRYYEIENIPVLSENGEIEYIIYTTSDVTDKEIAV